MIEHEDQIQKQRINIVRRNILLPRQTYENRLECLLCYNQSRAIPSTHGNRILKFWVFTLSQDTISVLSNLHILSKV